jgi:cytochrome c oxidase cbb3-type subunit 3
MTCRWFRQGLMTAMVLGLGSGLGAVLLGQEQGQIRVTGQGGGAPGPPAPGASQVVPRTPPVDPEKHDQGKELWAKQCVDCHGTQARGSATGPNIIRSTIVNRDRSSLTPGAILGPFLQQGHPTQSGVASSTFTLEQSIALAHFLRARVNDTMRGSASFVPGDVLTGDAKAGAAFFTGDGGCTACHNATTRNLAGIRSRLPSTVALQQRMLFPMTASRGGRRGAPPADAPAPGPNAITVTITPPSGPAVSGVLVEEDSFYVTLRDASGVTQVVRRVPGMKVVTTNPFQSHIDLLDRMTDKNIHDLVAHLETLK